MKRVTLFAESAGWKTGIARYTRSIAHGITRLRPDAFEFRLAVRYLKRVPSLDQMNLTYTGSALPGNFQNFLRNHGVSDELLYGRSSIIHEPDYQLTRVSGSKVILTVHDVGWKISGVSYGLHERFINKAEAAIAGAHKIITPTESVKKDVVKFYHFNPDHITVIPHGAEELFTRPVCQQGASVLPETFWLFVGEMNPRKNIQRIIAALASTEQKIPLVAVGPSTDYGHGMIKLAEEHGVCIIPLTDVSDEELAWIYSSCLGLVYPSLWEGFGMPIIEAALTGAPVITSGNTAMAEIGSGFAVFVNPLETGDIVKGLKHVTELSLYEREALKRAGKQAASKYTWKNSIESHIVLYQEVMDRTV